MKTYPVILKINNDEMYSLKFLKAYHIIEVMQKLADEFHGVNYEVIQITLGS
jgi:hypothetical protein